MQILGKIDLNSTKKGLKIGTLEEVLDCVESIKIINSNAKNMRKARTKADNGCYNTGLFIFTNNRRMVGTPEIIKQYAAKNK